MDAENIKNKSGEKPRLSGYYYVIQLAGIFYFLILLFLIRTFSAEVLFKVDTETLNILMLAMLVLHTTLFLSREIFKLKIFYDISRYVWVVFWLSVLYLSGGVDSQLIFLLLFPLIVSASDLNKKETKIMGIILTFGLGLMIFDPRIQTLTKAITARHIVITSIYAMIAYFFYAMVKNTLRQRFEKEEAKKKYIILIELDKLKSSFVDVASHQLRTPLTGVKWAINEISLGEELSKDKKDMLRQAREKIDVSIDIVNRMLKTADTGVGSFNAHLKELISPSELVREIISELSYLTEQKRVRLTLSDSAKGVVLGDRETLKAALMNVIDNAMRYSSGGNVEIEISEKEKRLLIVVKDDGIGILEEDKNFIFERFFRGKNAISADPNESGVGLYITKNIIEFHGGTISLISELGKGTAVTIMLPLLEKE